MPRLNALLVIGVATSMSCGGSVSEQTKLESVTKAFADVVDSSAEALKMEVASKPRVRRAEALQRFLVDPTDPANFTLDGEQRAFANYLCAGATTFRNEVQFLAFAKSYASGAEGIVKPGGDSFAEQWKKYKELQKPISVPNVPKPDGSGKDLFKQCTKELLAETDGKPPLLRFSGVPATDMTDEIALAAIPAAVEAFSALLSALETAAKDGLKAVNAVEARKKFSAYVNAVHQRFQGSISTDLDPDRMNDAWRRRKAQSLWRPYLTFMRILELKRKNASAYDIKELATKLEGELAEYDAIRATQAPGGLVRALSAAENAVLSAATDEKVSLDALIELLGAVSTEAKSLVNDYADVEKKTAAAISAAEAVFR